MTDDQILNDLKDAQEVLGINASLLQGVIDALEDRLSVQDWACGSGGELNYTDEDFEDDEEGAL